MIANSETKTLLCGCTEDQPCEDHEIDSEDRCEVHEGDEPSDRCSLRATYVCREPFTPGRFQIQSCDGHAKGMIRNGYSLDPSPEWSFPELTPRENSTITKARLYGYAAFFPCVNGGQDQAQKTLAGAREFLEAHK